MDLSKFSMEELILTAIKSEKEAFAIYDGIAKQLKNAALKDQFVSLAKEEEKHEAYLTEAFHKLFPQKEIRLPETTQVPLPEIHFDSDQVHLSEILDQAMQAELAAHEFYKSLSDRFDADNEIKEMLLKLSDMEMKHYELLKKEKEEVEKTEEMFIAWDMIHLGV